MASRLRSRPGAPLRSVGPESRGSAGSMGHAGPAGRAGGAAGAEPARVLVDGRNVQHALARDLGSALPTAALIAQLRAAFPPPTQVELILDGHPGRGPQGRVAPGLAVVFSKGAIADDVIGARVSEAFRALGPVETWSVLVVTDDREVRDHARRNGIRVEGTAWLGARMRGPARGPARGASGGPAGGPMRCAPGTSIGNARPPRVRPDAPREPKG